jgi:type IV secretory pathway VirB10-like protein
MRFLDFGVSETYDLHMMFRAAVAALVAVLAVAGAANAQSLAEVARAEEARRKAMSEPVKVYTNDDLNPDFSRPTPPPATGTTPGDSTVAPTEPADKADAAREAGETPSSSATAGGTDKDEAYWRERMTSAQAQVDRTRMFAQAVQNRIDMLWTDFVNRDDPVQRSIIEQDRNKALAELEQLKKDMETQQQAIADLEREARRANVPRGWLRPQ